MLEHLSKCIRQNKRKSYRQRWGWEIKELFKRVKHINAGKKATDSANDA